MINKVVLVGRLVRDPELKKSPGGYSVCRFTIACDRKGSKQSKQADFVNCIVWRQGADFLTKFDCWNTKTRIKHQRNRNSQNKAATMTRCSNGRRWTTSM